jgi:hypothetical protein
MDHQFGFQPVLLGCRGFLALRLGFKIGSFTRGGGAFILYVSSSTKKGKKLETSGVLNGNLDRSPDKSYWSFFGQVVVLWPTPYYLVRVPGRLAYYRYVLRVTTDQIFYISNFLAS